MKVLSVIGGRIGDEFAHAGAIGRSITNDPLRRERHEES
jgi:hypothetical protein